MQRETLTSNLPARDQRRGIAPVVQDETPEQAQLRTRIERLRTEVTEAAAELEELRATLAAFEARYEVRVGVLIVELDRLNLEIVRSNRLLAAL